MIVEMLARVGSQDVRLTFDSIGKGSTTLLLIGPLSIYQHYFPLEFLDTFEVVGFVGCVWENPVESDKRPPFVLTRENLLSCYEALVHKLDKNVVWFGVSALSVLALECALKFPEYTLATITNGLPIWSAATNAQQYLTRCEELFLQCNKDKRENYRMDQADYTGFCERELKVAPNLAGFVSSAGLIAETKANLEKCFYTTARWRNSTDNITQQALSAWGKMNLESRGFAYQHALSYDATRLEKLQTPVLSITGAHDVTTPPILVEEYLAQASPHVRSLMKHVTISDAAHFAYFEQPSAYIAEVSRFITQSPSLRQAGVEDDNADSKACRSS